MIWIWFNQLTLYLNPSSWHSSMLPVTLMNVSLSWAHAWPCLHDLTRESDLRQRCHVPRHGDNWHQSHDHHQRSCWPQNHDPCAFCSQDTYLHIWQVTSQLVMGSGIIHKALFLLMDRCNFRVKHDTDFYFIWAAQRMNVLAAVWAY